MHDDTSTTEANTAEMNATDDSTEEAYFMKIALCAWIDNIVTGLTVRFNAAKKLAGNFDFFVEISNNV